MATASEDPEEIEVVMTTVHFDGNGGTPDVETMEVPLGGTVERFLHASRTGYTFDGWWDQPVDGERVSTFTQINGETTFYAHWTPTQYEITYELNGRGTVPESAKTTYTIEDETYVPPLPEQTLFGFTFRQWIPDGIPHGSYGDIEFKADWISEKPKVAVCSTSKAGSQNLNDWIEHHIGIGFDHVYVYNSGEVDGYKQILQDYPLDNITIVDFPRNHEKDYKVAAYAHFFRTHRAEYDWIAFIDPDDYIMLVEHDSIKEVLSDIRFQHFDAIRLNMVDFSNYQQFARDFDFQGEDVISLEKTATTKKMAKSILNCKAKGLFMGAYTPTRNGNALNQCLPNLEPVSDRSDNMTKKGTDVNKVDTSIMYVTPNQMEIRWRKWKREKGY